MVIHVAVAALLVLEQQGGVVDGRELDEPMVEVGEVAPLDLRGGELRIENAGSCAADDDVRRRLERAAVVVGSVDDALRLRKLEDHNQVCR